MRSPIFSTIFCAVVFCMTCLTQTASAGPVLLRDVSAVAKVIAANQIGDDEEIDAELLFPSSDILHAQSAVGDRTDLGWNFVNQANRATIAIDIKGVADAIGEAHAEVLLSFVTTRPLNFRLTISAETAGAELFGTLNDQQLKLRYDPLIDPGFESTRTISGLLPPGTHSYAVAGTSGFYKFFPVPVDGATKLELAAAVPLPAGVWPGLTLLVAVTLETARRKLAARPQAV